MHHIIKQLIFLARSGNHHGVHSPFVYRYVTECLYKRPRPYRNKSMDVLFKSIRYFSVTHLLLLGDMKTMENQIAAQFPNLHFGVSPFDLIYLQASDIWKLWPYIEANDTLHNGSLVIVNAPHSSKAWEQLKTHPMIRVTIDLFYCGVVFLRKEQAKEHFKIRI